jgi:hypothetical protein
MLPKIEPLKNITRRDHALVEYRLNKKGPFYKSINSKQKYFIIIVVRPGSGLLFFNKGS